MKPFNQLSQQEINNLTPEEFNAIPPEEKRSCHDCNHLKAFVSLWCTNEQAKKARGTYIPGCIKCPYWEAKETIIPKQEIIQEVKTSSHYIFISILLIIAITLSVLLFIFKAH